MRQRNKRLSYPTIRLDTQQVLFPSKVPMRALMAISILGCIVGTAAAQTTPPAPATDRAGAQPGKGDAGRRSAKKNTTNEALASCLAQWEKSTHMTKQEWGRACRRVADRLRNLTVK